MTVASVGSQTALSVQTLVEMRRQLDDLQRQLGTGKKAETYAGVGLARGLAVGLRAQLATLGAYDDAINNVGVRINLAQSALGRIADIGHDVKSSAFQVSKIDSSGSTVSQSIARSGLGEILGLLNTQVGDRYIFSGRAADLPAVETLDHIMDGDGARAGLKQIIAERNQADLGADNLGRLVISAPTATSVAVAEDMVSPFGLKLAGISSSLAGATVSGPTGSPASMSVDLGATNPNDGDTIQFRFTLPDGTSEAITLTATSSTNPGTNEFSIGATPAITATNLQVALTAATGTVAKTSLAAASAVAASKDFFGDPPQRVAGSPFTATGFVAGSAADTVIWYTGERGPDPARSTATARVDSSIGVSYGLRANEEGIRWVVQNIAALAAASFSPTDPDAAARSAALNQRVGANLDVPPGTQTIEEIEADLAGAQITLGSATERHKQTKSTLADMLEQIEGVPTEDVAAQLMALQIRLQASLQTTAMLYQTSLVNYI